MDVLNAYRLLSLRREEKALFAAAAWLVSLPQEGGLGDHAGDDVGVHVGRRPAVLEVALAFLLRVAPHTDGRAAVRNALRNVAETNSEHPLVSCEQEQNLKVLIAIERVVVVPI